MARKDYPPGHFSCSFCGKSQREVRRLIAGPTVYICDECIRLCTEIIQEDVKSGQEKIDEEHLPHPREIHTFLDAYVIGQAHAKKVISVAVYNHYKRILSEVSRDGVELHKSNVLLIGPTGTGKTLLAQTLARLLDVPFTIADATTLTEAGYVGEDVETIVSNLLVAADNDVDRAQRGIIYIDEIDKIARKGDSPSVTRDVSGEGVQQALLKIIEGTVANITPRGAKKYGQTETVQVDTRDILVICGGSFTGIDEVIKARTGKKSMGFGAEIQGQDTRRLGEILRLVEPEDLTRYGIIPEFAGRLPVLATLEDLDIKALVRVLTEPKNALVKQYQKLFSLESVELSFDNEALELIATRCVANKSGARGLRAIMESVMLEIMYEVPFIAGVQHCLIHADVVRKKAKPRLSYVKKKSA